ncbi:GvpL/GvpF family gas vesicle protein [Geodermatophilus ruber]|uniref:Gas vesicle synthesis protein GvpL/GvpF n=1 Tax=Geodermatophilus ruber TaxID=504800 RepID=A0A1I4CEQ7_9ACTN|nr:GvpL/GvpF family gas vesicle protein [Geodermatophilus ruber]SFK79435.1 Gas vesicle synthesis protein GvpL/GvpF [Geodermatophilus ruber]
MSSPADTARYVYGLVSADTVLPDGLTGLGPSGQVWKMTCENVAAIVGDVPDDRRLGRRRHLMAHEAVVEAVAAESTILPMRFGAVITEEGVMTELLAPQHEYFAGVLEELDGRTQYTLKGHYDLEAVLPGIIQNDEGMRALHERIRGLSEEAAHFDRIQLGELIAQALKARRQQDAQDIVDALGPHVAVRKVYEPEQDGDVVNAAFLVERARQREFEDAVDEVAGRFPMLRLKLHGPLAPYDFVSAR